MFYELHCHSNFSDGDSTPKQIVEYAKTFLDGIAITDHDEIKGSLEALKYAGNGFEVIPAVEVSSKEGHILALYVEKLIEKNQPAKDTIDAIKGLGGIAIAAHPFDSYRRGVGDLISKLDFDAVEVENGHTFKNTKDPVSICVENQIPMVGGSDAHLLKEVGSVRVGFEKELRTAIVSGKIGIESKPKIERMLYHGAGILKRKANKLKSTK